MPRLILLLVLTGLSPSDAAGQAGDVAGVWDVVATSGARREIDGTITLLGEGRAILELSQEGDSLWGRVTRFAPNGSSLVWRVEGSVRGDQVAFESVGAPMEGALPGGGGVEGMNWTALLGPEGLNGTFRPRLTGGGLAQVQLPWRATRQ